ncbi:MAG: hypothetical protein QOE61_4224, partial [Micromonosporaceae bacterium]|nr:hypothetical protein [Micromonosporaceae bacterium]
MIVADAREGSKPIEADQLGGDLVRERLAADGVSTDDAAGFTVVRDEPAETTPAPGAVPASAGQVGPTSAPRWAKFGVGLDPARLLQLALKHRRWWIIGAGAVAAVVTVALVATSLGTDEARPGATIDSGRAGAPTGDADARAARDVAAQAEHLGRQDPMAVLRLRLAAYALDPVGQRLPLAELLLRARPTGVADAGIGRLEALAFSPDGRGLAIGGQYGAQLWSVDGAAGPARQSNLDGGTTAVTSLAYSQGGRRMLLSSDGNGQVWDVANPTRASQVGYFAPGAPRLRSVTPVGASAAAAATEDGHILTWTSVDPATTPNVLAQGLGPFANLAATPDGHHLYVADTTGTVKGYNVDDITRPRLEATLPHEGTVGDLATSTDGTRLLVGHGDQATLWDVTNPEKPVRLAVLGEHTGQVAGVALAPDNRSAVTVGARSAILWDLSQPAKPTYVASLFDNTNIVSAVAYSPDSSTVATASWDGTVRLWNVAELRAYRTGDLRPVETADTTLPDAGAITQALLSPDGQTLLTTTIDGTNRVWDLRDPADVSPQGSFPTSTGKVAFNNDGTTVIAAQTGTSPSVSVWGMAHVAAPQRLATLASGPVDALALSGDGRRAVTAEGSTATLWNLDVRIGPQQAATIHADHPITAATLTPGGKTLVLGHDNGAITVWAVSDPTRPAKIRTLSGPGPAVEYIALTAGSSRAVSVDQRGSVV